MLFDKWTAEGVLKTPVVSIAQRSICVKDEGCVSTLLKSAPQAQTKVVPQVLYVMACPCISLYKDRSLFFINSFYFRPYLKGAIP